MTSSRTRIQYSTQFLYSIRWLIICMHTATIWSNYYYCSFLRLVVVIFGILMWLWSWIYHYDCFVCQSIIISSRKRTYGHWRREILAVTFGWNSKILMIAKTKRKAETEPPHAPTEYNEFGRMKRNETKRKKKTPKSRRRLIYFIWLRQCVPLSMHSDQHSTAPHWKSESREYMRIESLLVRDSLNSLNYDTNGQCEVAVIRSNRPISPLTIFLFNSFRRR